MDFRDSPEEAAFRAGLRHWLRDHPAPEELLGTNLGEADVDVWKQWSRALYDAGYAGLTWPTAYGGGGSPHNIEAIYLEETARAQAPPHICIMGLGMAGPTILQWGTEEQKRRFAPHILDGSEVWCQGFSEPGAGSDLASVATRAVLDGEDWVVNGQKVWSSWAHIADWCILLVRTDADAGRHRGLSYLLLDMHAPGVEVRPLRQITGDPEFNEIFLTDVRVPRTSMLGRPGDGWNVAMTTLSHERGTFGLTLTARLEVLLRQTIELAREPDPDGARPADDPAVRRQLAQHWIELQALRTTALRALSNLLETGQPGPESTATKLGWSEASQRLTHLARELAGPAALESGGYWSFQQLRSRGNTLEAGTSEVLRGIIAERVLGLPRSR
jgi:alkylation response protein AidB-like acyl-CoA dehydrogenase